eukprot:COSAG06_NODE_1492_length_9279_cov_835.540632_1_plen_122_part_00
MVSSPGVVKSTTLTLIADDRDEIFACVATPPNKIEVDAFGFICVPACPCVYASLSLLRARVLCSSLCGCVCMYLCVSCASLSLNVSGWFVCLRGGGGGGGGLCICDVCLWQLAHCVGADYG